LWSDPQWFPPSAPRAVPLFNGKWIGLGAIGTDETVADAIEAIGRGVRGEVVISPRLIEEIVLNDAVGIPGAAGVERHLEVLVVDFDMVKGEFDEGEHAQRAARRACVLDLHIPEFDVVRYGNENCLLRIHAVVARPVAGIGEAMAAFVPGLLQTFPHGLPRNGPIVARRIIAQVHIVAGTVEGDAVLPETGDPVMLGALVE
jgi:hypothetical protein